MGILATTYMQIQQYVLKYISLPGKNYSRKQAWIIQILNYVFKMPGIYRKVIKIYSVRRMSTKYEGVSPATF